jgi:hypothetical protein
MPMCVVLRQEHQHAPGDRHLRRQPRALGADRVLDHLHHQRLALEHLPFDRHRGRAVDAAAVGRMQVGHMQERGPFEADIDECALHAGQHPRHLAEVDVADQAALERTLDVQLLHRAVLDDGHARLLRCPVDQDVVVCHGSSLGGAGPGHRKASATPARRRSRAVSCSGSPITPE